MKYVGNLDTLSFEKIICGKILIGFSFRNKGIRHRINEGMKSLRINEVF
jgi:hypothetical protein